MSKMGWVLRIGFLILGAYSGRVSALTFEEWQAQHFDASQLADETISGPTASPMRDWNNLQKFSMALDPWTCYGPEALSVFLDAEILGMTYRESTDAAGVARWFQSSSDLRHWTTHNTITESDRQAMSGFDSVTVEFPAPVSDNKQFARLLILLDPIESILRAPTAVDADFQAPSGARIRFSDNSPSEVSYAVERRALDETTFTRLGMVGSDITAYTDPTPTATSFFRYRVVTIGDTTEIPSEDVPFIRPTDSDRDGLDDAFEMYLIQRAQSDTDPTNDNLLTLADIHPQDDWDWDSLSNEYENYLDSTGGQATDYYNGTVQQFELKIIGGLNQETIPGEVANQPLQLLVTQNGSPAPYAPVDLEAGDSGLLFSTHVNGTFQLNLRIIAGEDGVATAVIKWPEETP
jgi:hypothetical protein